MSKTYIGKFEGETEIWCDLADEQEVGYLLHDLCEITGGTWRIFHEETGKCNTVIYDADMFEVSHRDGVNYLHYIGKDVVSLPFNASSCYYMFEDYAFSDNFVFKNPDTRNITNLVGMFSGAVFPENIHINTQIAIAPSADVSDMFKGAVPENIKDLLIFDKEKYLEGYNETLPEASVKECFTKEDCDSLLERLGVN